MNEHIVVNAIKCESIRESSPYISINAIVKTMVGMPDSIINALPMLAFIENNKMQAEANNGANSNRIIIAGISNMIDFH